MKPEVTNPSPNRGPGTGLLRFCEAILGITVIGAAVLALSACQPDTSSGDGVDPGIIEIPIALIKRPIPLDDMGEQVQADLRDPLLFSPGGDVYLRSSTAVGASLTNITRPVTGGQGDVKGLNVSHDGSKLVFSLRLFDPDPDDDFMPSWNIYEYDVESRQLRRVITDAQTARDGDDLFPSYLPDGRIVFTSNRQHQSQQSLINEGKPGYRSLVENGDSLALVLHVINADGTGLRQISFNQSHDLYPQVMSRLYDGKIVFSRWDKAVVNDAIHLYSINPDGSELDLLYGYNSHFTGSNDAEIQFANLREMENGDLMVITRPFTGTFGGGDIVIIDAARFVDNDKPLWSLAGLKGPAQQSATSNPVVNDGSISIAGRYGSAYPLWDGSDRILVSKSTCQLIVGGIDRPCVEPWLSDTGAVEGSPAYAIWLYDRNEGTEKPIVLAERDVVITEVVTVQERELPTIIFDRSGSDLDSEQRDANVGVVNIKSVYDMGDGNFDGCYFGFCTPVAGIERVEDVDYAAAAALVATTRRYRIRPIPTTTRSDRSASAACAKSSVMHRLSPMVR